MEQRRRRVRGIVLACSAATISEIVALSRMLYKGHRFLVGFSRREIISAVSIGIGPPCDCSLIILDGQNQADICASPETNGKPHPWPLSVTCCVIYEAMQTLVGMANDFSTAPTGACINSFGHQLPYRKSFSNRVRQSRL